MNAPAWLSAEAQFDSWFSSKDQWSYAFTDARAAMGRTGLRKVVTDERPADRLVFDRGDVFLAEVKSCEEKVSFPFSNIRKGQWMAVRLSHAAKGKYYFFIRNENTKVWYRIPGIHLYNVSLERKSIKWAELEEFRWER